MKKKYQSFQNSIRKSKDGTFPSLFYEDNIILLSKSDKDFTKKTTD